MRPDGTIDVRRYPRSLDCEQATWYRNATTVADQTTRALPAMLSGSGPRRATSRCRGPPRHLFSLLGDSHRLEVTEVASDLCEESCGAPDRPPATTRLRSLASDLWVVAGAAVAARRHRRSTAARWTRPSEALTTSTAAGAPGAEVALPARDPSRPSRTGGPSSSASRAASNPARQAPAHFLHSVLPHLPAEYLPGARRYSLTGLARPASRTRSGVPTLGWRSRHPTLALQIAAVDTLIGRCSAGCAQPACTTARWW